MGVRVAFCDRFKDEELGYAVSLKRSDALHHDTMGFEYMSQRKSVSFATPGWKNPHGPIFAHIGEALKGFVDGKGRSEFLEGVTNAAQDVAKRTEHFLGLGKQPLKVEFSSLAAAKGETIAVLVSLHFQRGALAEISRFFFRKNPQPDARVRVLYDGCEVPVFPTASDNKLLRALVPTTPLTTPGPRALLVEVDDGRHEVFEEILEVTEKEYPVESIWLPKTKSKIRGTVMEKEKVAALTGTLSAEQMWNGPFVLPSDGEITTGYGLQRYYNGVFANHYYHRGVDYGAWEGDPVKAPAKGRVVLVGKEKDGYEIHGNCVGLDHGHGVTSIMMHLNSAFVKEGEMVQAGQIIGTVGETGIATGPHLHWGLHVRGEAVDPHPWMQEQIWI